MGMIPFTANLAASSCFTLGAPVLACVHKGVPGIFMDCHMMVAEPEKVTLPRLPKFPC
jgi:pentose-5-phosphate-3-epimerase